VDRDLPTQIREITDDEVAFFEENGWVMLRALFGRELTGALLSTAVESLNEANHDQEGVRFVAGKPSSSADINRTVALSPQMGRVAHRLVNRARLTDDVVPILFEYYSTVRKEPGAAGTAYHQDSAALHSDRIGEFTLWLALDEVTPQMGAMRFVTRSHREGLLGINSPLEPEGQRRPTGRDDPRGQGDLLACYPKLLDLYELSPPFHYQPGDATAHKGYMIHGGPPNAAERERWSLILSYTPADTRYVNGDARSNAVLRPLDDALNPIVYPIVQT
jgi:hypothetical protein